jgi:hypothetical protein
VFGRWVINLIKTSFGGLRQKKLCRNNLAVVYPVHRCANFIYLIYTSNIISGHSSMPVFIAPASILLIFSPEPKMVNLLYKAVKIGVVANYGVPLNSE